MNRNIGVFRITKFKYKWNNWKKPRGSVGMCTHVWIQIGFLLRRIVIWSVARLVNAPCLANWGDVGSNPKRTTCSFFFNFFFFRFYVCLINNLVWLTKKQQPSCLGYSCSVEITIENSIGFVERISWKWTEESYWWITGVLQKCRYENWYMNEYEIRAKSFEICADVSKSAPVQTHMILINQDHDNFCIKNVL